MAKVKPFNKIYTEDQELVRVQEAISDSISILSSIAILDAKVIENIAVATTPTQINHGLDRVPVGFIVVDRTANVNVWRDASGVVPSKILTLVASAPATISILVF